MIAVPASPAACLTVPSTVGTEFLAVLCGLEAPVPTVTTYKYIYIKDAHNGRADALLDKVGANWWEQGTVSRKPAQNSQNRRSKASSDCGNTEVVGNGS